MSIRKLLLLLPALCLLAGGVQAQTVKEIAVSAGASYTDHISLAEDSKDTDVMVKFVFDEEKNTLTVSVLSYRTLFVFQEPARYVTVVRYNCLIPERLPYLADAGKGSRFALSKALVKALPRPRKKYVFRRWVEYDGLQRVPTDYKMVNDYIEQAFDINGKRGVVSVTLRDVYLLDNPGGKPDSYRLVRGRDLDTKYQVRILRNPCLGLDEEIVAARKAYGEVKSAYEGFKGKYAGGTVASEELLKVFGETQAVLLTQFPRRENLSPCPDIQDATERYNQYVDSIANYSCKVHAPDVTGGGAADGGRGLDTKLVYSQARQLDKAVARYLVSADPLERADLVSQCKEIISDMSSMIERQAPKTVEEKNAVRVYRQAEQYFKKTCGQ